MSEPTGASLPMSPAGAGGIGHRDARGRRRSRLLRRQEIKACADAGITVTLPKPQTSGAKAEGRFGKQDFVYDAADDVYRCPAGERLTYRFTREEHGKMLRRYWTNACRTARSRPSARQGGAADLSLGA